MDNYNPPVLNCWARCDHHTQRLTGEHLLLPVDENPGGDWHLVDHRDALQLVSGSLPWNHMAVVGDRVTRVDPKVDLRYLSFIDCRVWPELQLIDEKWTNVPWIPLDIPRIVPDDWGLFWQLWKEKNADITRGGTKETQYWKGLCCWLNPRVDHTKFNYNNTVVDDWSKHFPRMFEQIQDCLPFYSMEKIVLWSNINEVNPHVDPDGVIYPWPDSLRIMIWDSNDGPTFWLSRWPRRGDGFNPSMINQRRMGNYGIKSQWVPKENRIYVDLPPETNTFVFNNGAFIHGADLAKPKIIMAVKGRPIIWKWLQALGPSYEKYQERIKKC